MFILHQTSVKIAVLLHKQAKVPFVLDLAVCVIHKIMLQIQIWMTEAILLQKKLKNLFKYLHILALMEQNL